MPPDFSEIDSPLVYRLCIIQRTSLLEKMADTNEKKGQARYTKDRHKHGHFEPCFAAGDYVIAVRPRTNGIYNRWRCL